MTNLARFKITGSIGGESPSTDRGYDFTPGESIALNLEASANLVRTAEYLLYDAGDPQSPLNSLEAAELVADNNVDVAGPRTAAKPAPTSSVFLGNFPDARTNAYSWRVRCLVDGGIDPRTNREDPERVFERVIAIRNSAGQRAMVPGETTEYSARSWSDEQNRQVLSANIGHMLGSYVSNAPIQGVITPGDGWTVVSEFDLLTQFSTVKLESLLLVTSGALTGRVRLVHAPPGDSPTVIPDSTLDTQELTGELLVSVDLLGDLEFGERYQIQAECSGGDTDSDFAVVRYATLRAG